MESIGGSASIGIGFAKNLFGPANGTGDARSYQSGSISRRDPSISRMTPECPSQVTRSVSSVRSAKREGSDGNGPSLRFGSRSGAPFRNLIRMASHPLPPRLHHRCLDEIAVTLSVEVIGCGCHEKVLIV